MARTEKKIQQENDLQYNKNAQEKERRNVKVTEYGDLNKYRHVTKTTVFSNCYGDCYLPVRRSHRYRRGRSGVRRSTWLNRHSVANDSPPLRRF